MATPLFFPLRKSGGKFFNKMDCVI
jgi:hypothetical protein